MIKREKSAVEAAVHPYKTRTGGATVTVFVPYDCKNHCPFCVNKEEYADMTGFSLEAICRSIEKMDTLTPYCDFVFTGGEPLANLQSLQIMLDKVSETHKIYINTTLPVSRDQTEEEVLAFLQKNRRKITCLNISRHMQHYAPSIQFRFDYTETTPENLYDEPHDQILRDLKKVACYTGLDGCRMRCGFHFKYKDLELVYHKTLPYSTIVEKDPGDGETYAILYDILIKQNGRIDSDWDGTMMDVDAYARCKFEPYDLKWLERVPAWQVEEEEEELLGAQPCTAV